MVVDIGERARCYLCTGCFHEGVWVERYALVLNFVELISCLEVLPELGFLSLWEFFLDDFVHGILEAFSGCESIEAIVAAVVLDQGFLAGSRSGPLVVEVGVREYDLAALIAPDWSLPREVL